MTNITDSHRCPNCGREFETYKGKVKEPFMCYCGHLCRMTDITEITLSEGATRLFIDLVEDAPNWSGTPGYGCNVHSSKQRDGYLTKLKKVGLLTTQWDEGIVWVYFTPLANRYAAELGRAGLIEQRYIDEMWSWG